MKSAIKIITGVVISAAGKQLLKKGIVDIAKHVPKRKKTSFSWSETWSWIHFRYGRYVKLTLHKNSGCL